MCGIAGAFGGKGLSRDRVNRSLSLMRRRGPDGQGHWSGRLRGNPLDLLHTRLSIQDLDSRSDQPFVRDGDILVYNGEIYNFPELRTELEGLGHHFTTTGDTEVILAAYRQWGPDCTTRFEGMWAFALYDSRADRLMLSRDRFGEKPLYIWYDGDVLYFGSEVRFLAGMAGCKPKINLEQLSRYLVNGYKALYPSGQTYFKDIREFPAGANALLSRPDVPDAKPFWSLSYNPLAMSQGEALEGVRERLEQAVRLRFAGRCAGGTAAEWGH